MKEEEDDGQVAVSLKPLSITDGYEDNGSKLTTIGMHTAQSFGSFLMLSLEPPPRSASTSGLATPIGPLYTTYAVNLANQTCTADIVSNSLEHPVTGDKGTSN